MLKKDYYVILGVSRTESALGIRAAYRALARRFHPDRVGPSATRHFQLLNEAYHVLSDHDRRRAYDLGLTHMGDATTARREPVPTPSRQAAPEPLVPDHSASISHFGVEGPALESVFHRFADSFPLRSRRARLRPVHFDVNLPRHQAFLGGVISFAVPVFYPCIQCRGDGWFASAPCRRCEGAGLAEDHERVSIAIPPMVRDGTIFEVPLRGLGVSNLYLELQLHVV